MRKPGSAVAVTALLLALAGCGGSSSGDQDASGITGTVTVFAASSLTEALRPWASSSSRRTPA